MSGVIQTEFAVIAADVRRIATEVTASEQSLALIEQVARLADAMNRRELAAIGIFPADPPK